MPDKAIVIGGSAGAHDPLFNSAARSRAESQARAIQAMVLGG